MIVNSHDPLYSRNAFVSTKLIHGMNIKRLKLGLFEEPSLNIKGSEMLKISKQKEVLNHNDEIT